MGTLPPQPRGGYNAKRDGKLTDHLIIKDLAQILTTASPDEAITLMEKYNSNHLLVTSLDYAKAFNFYKISGVETQIIDGVSLNVTSMVYKVLKQKPVEGFQRVYSDGHVVIYATE